MMKKIILIIIAISLSCIWAKPNKRLLGKTVAIKQDPYSSEEIYKIKELYDAGNHSALDALIKIYQDKDGRFMGLKVSTKANLGGYLNYFGPHSPTNNLGGLSGVYTTPHIFAEVSGVYTHTSPTAPYRGAGRPEASYVLERLIYQTLNLLINLWKNQYLVNYYMKSLYH